ncbi:MAG: GWxTD domain-containing protein [Rhodothermia bacterium]|nr:GWxTD domain-containing protein [Rhodothermia bacterium]
MLATTTHAQPLPVQLDVDVASFAFDEGSSLVEIYLVVEATSMQFVFADSMYQADLPLDLAIVRSGQRLDSAAAVPVWEDSLSLSFVIPDTVGLSAGQHFVHQVRTAVPPGEYQLEVLVPGDLALERQDLRMRLDALIPSYGSDDAAQISDITLATSIQPSADDGNSFYKNGVLVRPNANQLYGQGLTQLFFYAETYNTDAVSELDDEYTLITYLAEANTPNPMSGYSRRLERPVRSPDVIVGAFDLKDLPSGSYFLRLAILNKDNESLVEQARKFFVYNPNVEREQPAPVATAFESSPFASLTDEEVERELELIELIANEREKNRAKRIQDLDEKRRFLMTFWRARDPNPNVPSNSFREEFFQRLQYANERYSSSFVEGWKSDRGRVLMRHGLPSAIDPHLYERDTVPYEVWEYNNIPGEGQAVFVFADRSGFGQFDLIHSTVTGGTTLPNWQDELRRR